MNGDIHGMNERKQRLFAERFGTDAEMAIRLAKNMLTLWLKPTWGCGDTGYGPTVRTNRQWLEAERDRRAKKGFYCAVGGDDKRAALFAIDATDTIAEVRRVAALLARPENKDLFDSDAATESATESESEVAK